MDFEFPQKLSRFGGQVEQSYRSDSVFRDIYDDYLAYRKAYRFWVQSRSDRALERRSEYADLLSELEEELLQLLTREAFMKSSE